MMRTTRLFAITAALLLLAAGCGDDDSSGAEGPTCDQTGTLAVPGDFNTIQEAVNAAAPGALVLIDEGTYEEAVNVECDDVVIRGMDRNGVVLDGGFELENGIRVLGADGVVVENMTAQNYTGNGFFWTDGVDGYRGSYLTAIRNGDYGVYAYGSVNGVFEHSYASGSPDAGFYIGQCGDCNGVLDDVTSEWNGLGYSGTNSTNVTIMNSVFRHNRAGIVPNAGTYEGCAPPVRNTLVGNLVHDNGNSNTSAIDDAVEFEGVGILVAGTKDSVITRNRVENNPVAGIAITPVPEFDAIGPLVEAPEPDCIEDSVPVSEEEQADLPDPLVWHSSGNQVIDNVATGNGSGGGWDVALIEGPDEENCASGNDAESFSPANLETVAPCDGTITDYAIESAAIVAAFDADGNNPSVDFQDVELPDPGDLEGMEDPEGAPVEPARGPDEVDVAAIEVPPPPEDE